jgi:hypothetical protein
MQVNEERKGIYPATEASAQGEAPSGFAFGEGAF